MLVDDKPPLDEDLLQHFGVKGMKWGQRKDKPSSSTPQSFRAQQNAKLARRRVIADRTVKGALIVGGAAAAYMMFRKGKTPMSQVNFANIRVDQAKLRGFEKFGPTGERVAARMSQVKIRDARIADQAKWKSSVDALLKDMKNANDEQDAWMRSLGLGAVVNNAR